MTGAAANIARMMREEPAREPVAAIVGVLLDQGTLRATARRLHEALGNLPQVARGKGHGEVLGALQRVLSAADAGRSGVRKEVCAVTGDAKHGKRRRAVLAASGLPGSEDSPPASPGFQERCRAAGEGARNWNIALANRLGIKDGFLFNALATAYADAREQIALDALRKRAALLHLATAAYDRKNSAKNEAQCGTVSLKFGKDGLIGESTEEDHLDPLIAINHELQQALAFPEKLTDTEVARLCGKADGVWDEHGIQMAAQE